MNAEQLAGLGRVNKEVEVFKDLKVTYHSLSIGEEAEVNIAIASAPNDLLARTTILQIETLVRAIEKIGDRVYSNSDDLRKYLHTLQRHTLSALYSAWNDQFDQVSANDVAELKKNLVAPVAEPSGSTVKS